MKTKMRYLTTLLVATAATGAGPGSRGGGESAGAIG
jgi:hypothetical protein